MPDRARILQGLRAEMAKSDLDAYIVPAADEFLNEYLPPEAERRAFVSGFTGSAGDLLITRDDAWLYTDSRYYLRGDRQLEGTGIRNMKVGTQGAVPLSEHLRGMAATQAEFRVGITAGVVSWGTAQRLSKVLSSAGGSLEAVGQWVDPLWSDRPAPRQAPLLALDDQHTGASVERKITLVRDQLVAHGATDLVLNKLDQIAWLTNLRGHVEVPYNPVFPAFAHVGPNGLDLFLDDAAARLPRTWQDARHEVRVHPLDAWTQHLQSIEGRVSIDPSAITWATQRALESGPAIIVEHLSPVELLKSRKNEAEVACMQRANELASVAKTKALIWMRRQHRSGQAITEESFARKLEAEYAALDGYHSLSFNTISAVGANSADVHYGDCAAITIEEGQLFLIDSGCHVANGTTDDTRTVALGSVDPEAKVIYTLVLKGHIQAARQRVPSGTHGATLDALARGPLWNANLDYGHGTGHGVGAFLNVHEGPISISACRGHTASSGLHPGNVFSIEPGFYREGYGGVRIENLYLAIEEVDEQERAWLKMESLTWIPFELRLMDHSMLEPSDIAWLGRYHERCRAILLPHLDADEASELEDWLAGN